MGSSLPKVRDFPVMKCRYIVPLDPAYLPTAGKQGGDWGATCRPNKIAVLNREEG